MYVYRKEIEKKDIRIKRNGRDSVKYRVTVQVPVEKRGLFGRKKIVYEERTVTVDKATYSRIKREQEEKELDDFLDDMEIMDAIFDD